METGKQTEKRLKSHEICDGFEKPITVLTLCRHFNDQYRVILD